jgi:hypothetical protein
MAVADLAREAAKRYCAPLPLPEWADALADALGVRRSLAARSRSRPATTFPSAPRRTCRDRLLVGMVRLWRALRRSR